MLKFIVEQSVSGKICLEIQYFSTTIFSMDVDALSGLKDVDALKDADALNQCYCFD